MKKRIFFPIIFILCLLTAISPLGASAYTVDADYPLNCDKYILVSLDTNEVVAGSNTAVKNHPAGLTQIMTALLAAETYADLNTQILYTDTGLEYSRYLGGVGMDLLSGEYMTVRDHLKRMLISGKADSAIALAFDISDSIALFVQKMNKRAKELGMNNTEFKDPVGMLPGAVTTCEDMAKLCKEFVKKTDLCDIVRARRTATEGTNMASARDLFTTNYMIDDAYPSYYYRYAKGGKTGYSNEAGRCLFQMAEYGGARYFAVLLGCASKDEEGNSVRYDFSSARQLFRWAFLELKYVSVVRLNEPLAEVEVELALSVDHVGLVPKQDVYALVPEKDLEAITYKAYPKSDTVQAPIAADQVLGYAEIYCSGQLIATVDLVAQTPVKRNFTLFLFDRLSAFFTAPATLIVLGVLFALALIGAVWLYRYNRKQRRMNSYRRRR